jgi:Sulfotransferase domain
MKFDGVIGAGWGRTGTLSLRVALENHLGLGPAMHTFTLFDNVSFTEHFNLLLTWIEIGIAKRNGNKERVKKLLSRAMARFKSSVDFPSCLYFEELQEIYPERLVILSVRESAEQWYDSFGKTVLLFVNPTPARDIGLWLFLSLNPYGILISTFHQLAWKQHSIPSGILNGTITQEDQIKQELIHAYNEWIENVKAKVPKNRLLVFDSKQGWEPLVKALGIDEVPQSAFPSVNDRTQIDKSFEACRKAGWATLVIYVIVLLMLTRWAFRPPKANLKQKLF